MKPEELCLRDLLEATAEEAGELIQACMKLIRTQYGNNMTPVTKEQALANLVEEIADLGLCITTVRHSLGVSKQQISEIQGVKYPRWCKRLSIDKEE